MKNITLLALIIFIHSWTKAQDTTITLKNHQGKGYYMNNKEVGHWQWTFKPENKVEDWYYIDSNTILKIDRHLDHSGTLNSIVLLKYAHETDSFMSIQKSFYFQSAPGSLRIESFSDFESDSIYIKAISFYPNGMKKTESYLLKSNQNFKMYKMFDSINNLLSWEIYTDSTIVKTNYYTNKKIKTKSRFILKNDFTSISNKKYFSLTEDDYEKDGRWEHYNEIGEIILVEQYVRGVLQKKQK